MKADDREKEEEREAKNKKFEEYKDAVKDSASNLLGVDIFRNGGEAKGKLPEVNHDQLFKHKV